MGSKLQAKSISYIVGMRNKQQGVEMKDTLRNVLEMITMMTGTWAGILLLVFVFISDKADALPHPFTYEEAMIMPIVKGFCVCAYAFIIMTITLFNMRDKNWRKVR